MRKENVKVQVEGRAMGKVEMVVLYLPMKLMVKFEKT